jgi:signal transduction histidine kinase
MTAIFSLTSNKKSLAPESRPVKGVTFGLPGFVFLVMLLMPLGAPAQAPPATLVNLGAGQSQEPKTAVPVPVSDLSQKNILLIHAYTYETVANMIMDPIFIRHFVEAGLDGNNLQLEFLDFSKHPEPDHRWKMVAYLENKYRKQPIDLVITVHPAALQFLIGEAKDLFPGAPVINVLADPEFVDNGDFRTAKVRLMEGLNRPFVLMPFSLAVDATIRNILSLQPGTRNLAVISGNGFLDRGLEQITRRNLAAWQGRLKIEYLSALPLEEVLKRVTALPPESAVLFSNFSADPLGRKYRPVEVARRISQVSKAPVFGMFESIIGNKGIVGGTMPSFKREAEITVGLALEILKGKLPSRAVTFSQASFSPIFDWEQLQRWGMDSALLPAGTIVLNRPRTLWSEYKGFVAGSILLALVLTGLVIGLLFQGRRRRKVESSLQENERALRQNQNDLRELTGRLITAQEEERRYLARELHDDLTQRVAVLSMEAGNLEKKLDGRQDPVKEKIGNMKNQLIVLATDIHNMARQLHPSILDDLGLIRAIESECNAFYKREGIPVFFNHENVPLNLEKKISLTLYRTVQEGLRNTSKHACAEKILVSLKGANQEVQLSLQDNGIGFDLAGSRSQPGLGLYSLRERVRLTQGTFAIRSSPGAGTVITVGLPIQ